jgi:hypothetical protein
MPELLSQYSDWVQGWTTRVLFLTGRGIFSLRHRVQTDSGAHPASYPVGTKSSFPRVNIMSRLRMSGAIPPIPDKSLWLGTWLSTGTSFVTFISY